MPNYQQFIDRLFAKSEHAGIPLSGTFELTSRCNLDCRMCYIHKRANDAAAMRRELSADAWIRLAEKAQRKGMLLCLLTGGEPLLRPDFAEIYTVCRRLGLLVSVNTNGTLIDEKIVDLWRKIPPHRVNITVYGASAETYRRLCGNSEAYERVYRAIEALCAAGICCKLNFSAVPENIDDLPEIHAFANAHNVALQVATYMFPPIRAHEQAQYGCADCPYDARFSPEEAGRIRFAYDRLRFPEDVLAERMRNMLCGEKVDMADECQELPTERIRCRAGSTTFWVTCNGEMRPCGMMTTPGVSLSDTVGFSEAWKCIRRMRSEIMLPAKCTACSRKAICDFCPAACYAENGTFTESPVYLCRKLDSFLTEGKKWLSEYDVMERNTGEQSEMSATDEEDCKNATE